MPQFDFQGRDKLGQLIQGKREGDSAEYIANMLINEGIFPVRIIPSKEPAGIKIQLNTLLPSLYKVSTADLIMFNRQMASLYKAGIPLPTALTRLAEIHRSAAFAAALKGITHLLTSGKTLASAMQNYPKIFSPFIINLIRIGEESAQLDVAFKQAADYLSLQESNLRRIKTVFRYPLLVIASIIVAVIIINLFIMPAFAKMYGNLHIQLPLPTRILLFTSNFIKNYWYYLLAYLMIMAASIYAYIKTPAGQFLWAKYQFHIPIIGNIFARILLARIISTLAITIRGGIPLVEGINLIANTTSNSYLRQRLQIMRSALEQGETLTKAANLANLFNPLILQMLAVGEETGRMDDLLLQVSNFYEQEVDYDIQTLAARLEPILLFAVAGMVLLLALGVFLPMWDIIGLVH
jgi:MSHA biogenesis protein MshG